MDGTSFVNSRNTATTANMHARAAHPPTHHVDDFEVPRVGGVVLPQESERPQPGVAPQHFAARRRERRRHRLVVVVAAVRAQRLSEQRHPRA